MEIFPYLPYIVIGELTRDFILSPGGKSIVDIQGGHLFYAAAAIHHWEKQVGLVARIGPDYPQDWLDRMAGLGMDLRGVRRLDTPLETRSFISYHSGNEKERRQPMGSYANYGLPFPRELIGYTPVSGQLDSKVNRSPKTIISRDIPTDYFETRCVHFCPLDYLSHNILPSVFSRHGHKIITLEPSYTYMFPNFFRELPEIARGLSAFITSEKKMRNLFQEQYHADYGKMIETIAGWGAELVVVRQSDLSALLFDPARNLRVYIPPYSDHIVNSTGANSAFCGGFLVGLMNSYDPRDALLNGMTCASFTVEGASPYAITDVFPGLFGARREALAQEMREIPDFKTWRSPQK